MRFAVPHIIVKMIEGRSRTQKQELSDRLAEALMAVLGSRDEAVSVAIEDVPADKWESDVFLPEIKGRKETLYKKPEYASVD
ncbi:tautomerase family protein [Rhizobium anhuiense]|uniref:tautomerase family protein n=1 Tax=Rhizobium anhuiense TaxID=1184720 RepID=UPI002477E2B9|nr:4-oxalocrotonate tautomerase family protein [Rhizobium anhuiense]